MPNKSDRSKKLDRLSKTTTRATKTSARQSSKQKAARTQSRNPAPLVSKKIANLGNILAEIGRTRRLTEFRVSCVRPDDLLVCDFIFENLKLQTAKDSAPKLVRRPQDIAVLIVEFPPQSFGEEALLDDTGAEVPQEDFPETFKDPKPAPGDPPPPPFNPKNKTTPSDGPAFPGLAHIKIRMAGPSRIAFNMPAEEMELPFNIEAILDACRRWPMRLDLNAIADPPPFRIRREVSFYDLWLASLVHSNLWTEITRTLVDSVGGALQKRLAAAARRVSTKAVEGIRSGDTRELSKELNASMNEELDVIAERSTALRDPRRREVAAAALSLMTTSEMTKHRFGQSILDHLDIVPFLPVIFGPHEPAWDVTALELPYRLIISPVPESRWHHATKPVSRNGRTELWHSRLTSSKDDIGPDAPTNIRALWSDDYGTPTDDMVKRVNGPLPFRMSLDPLDREMLVKLMSGFDEVDKKRHPFHPKTARSKRLALSSLGALLDVEGEWNPPFPKGLSLEQWKHLATLGRDHYVRVVYRGFLCKPRHAASLIKVTERKFESVGNLKNRVAVLRQKFFIIVRERVKHYNGAGHIYEGRNFPFRDVEILTRVTPTLLAPDQAACQIIDKSIYKPAAQGGNNIPKRACFWPMLNSTTNFKFEIAATDLYGQRRVYSMPLLFVGIEANENDDAMEKILESYRQEKTGRRNTSFAGHSICYAPIDDPEHDTRLPTSSVNFTVRGVDDTIDTDEARFYPEIENADVKIAAIQRLLQQPDKWVSVNYPDAYLTTPGGFGATNSGELFLTLLTPSDLKFGSDVKSDSIGSLATPSMSILGLSRIMGPVAGQSPGAQPPEKMLGDIIARNFNPVSFFDNAKILGGVKLAEIISGISDLALPDTPKLLSRDLPDSLEASFEWSTSKFKGTSMFIPHAGGQTKLDMKGVVSARKDAKAPTFNATATLVHFKVNLFGFVTVWFDRLRFSAQTGSKPDVAVDLHPGPQAIEFGGPLEFVNDLRTIIPSNGFSDPPGLTVTPSGITASYSVNVPNLSVGIFALEHLSLGAGFLLPFDDKPAEVRFNFSERQRPFSLTVSLLGGGGFFAICVGTEGVREIEAALEFGAALSIDLGVASGSVEVKAGVYFHWKTTSVELAGYVRLHGELSVLGLISASLTFNLQLAYLKAGGKSVVWGEATLEVEISILFLSFSVSVSCRREFGGSAGDPKFIDLIPDQTTWDDYCLAFAKDM